MEYKNVVTEEMVEEIFNRNIAMARDPIDGSLLGQDRVLEAMKAAIRESFNLAMSYAQDTHGGVGPND